MSAEHTDALSAAADTLPCEALVIDHVAREVRVDDRGITLTPREYELLRFLMAHPRRVYQREALVMVVWGNRCEVGMRTIDGHVRRMRAKLGPDARDWIRTVRGVGYAYSPPVDEPHERTALREEDE